MSFTRLFAHRLGNVTPKLAFCRPIAAMARSNLQWQAKRGMAVAAERAADTTPITTIQEEPYSAFGSTYYLFPFGIFKCGRASIPQLAYENADTSLTLHPRYLLDVTDQDESKMRNFTINFGPQHPAAHVTSRSSISLSDESKVHLKLTNSSNFYRVC